MKTLSRKFVVGSLLILALILSACSQGSSPQTFSGSGVTLKYPGAWQPIDITKSSTCSQPGLECVVALGVSDDGTNLNVVRTDTAGMTLDQIDQQGWAQVSAAPDVQLTSHDAKQLGGQAAVERVFNLPSTNMASGRAYILQVYVIANGKFYNFTGLAPSSDAFTKHQQEIRDAINSVQFTP